MNLTKDIEKAIQESMEANGKTMTIDGDKYIIFAVDTEDELGYACSVAADHAKEIITNELCNVPNHDAVNGCNVCNALPNLN